MSDEQLDLTDIEARRDVAYADGSWDEPEWRDVIALLAEVKRLRAERDELLAEVERLRAVVEHIERLRDLAYARGFRGPVGMWLDEALAGPTEPPRDAEPVQWARVSGEATRERRKAEAGGP